MLNGLCFVSVFPAVFGFTFIYIPAQNEAVLLSSSLTPMFMLPLFPNKII